MTDDELSEDAVHVVVLELLTEDKVQKQVRPACGKTPIDLAAGAPSPPMVDELISSAVVLSAPDGVPAEVVAALLSNEIPAMFAADPWLREHRALVFHDGWCDVAGHRLRYDQEDGVYVDGHL